MASPQTYLAHERVDYLFFPKLHFIYIYIIYIHTHIYILHIYNLILRDIN
jgi:hypothetical protein